MYWLQCGGCGGDTMSLLNAEAPDLIDLIGHLGIPVLWHPSLSHLSVREHRQLVTRLLAGEQSLDLLVVEGAIIQGPDGSGAFDMWDGRPKKELVTALAAQAKWVVAVGTCASYGGMGDDAVAPVGLQFHRRKVGGLLGENFRSRAGLPVINLPGCPCHPDVVTGALLALVAEMPLTLDMYHRPVYWYGLMVHQGCTRNEYHEYRVEEEDFGQKGCMFFHMGCHGPLVAGPCNKHLWNRRSSKTRAGVPCFGCTSPEFPSRHPFFTTRNIEGIPVSLPNGVSRAHYMAYKGMAAASAPERLKKRITEI